MDLIELRQALRRGWYVGLLVAALVGVVGFVALGPGDDRPRARTTLVVTPRAERFQTVSPGVLRIVLPNVLVVARSADLREEAAEIVELAAPDVLDATVRVEGGFLPESGVLTITVASRSGAAATAWSAAIGEALEDRYDDDEYLEVSVLDRATSASPPPPAQRAVDLAGVTLVALFAGLLSVFALQRLRDSGDIVGRVRRGGLRVIGELVIPGRGSRPVFRGDDGARRLALGLAGAPGVTAGARFVVVSADTRPAVAVVDALRAGLEGVGLDQRHKVVLGPELGDLANLHHEVLEGGVIVPVLDRRQRIDEFVRGVHAIVDSGVHVPGVVVVGRRLVDRGRAIGAVRDRTGEEAAAT